MFCVISFARPVHLLPSINPRETPMTEVSHTPRIALVLGATSGIGGAIALAPADHGWTVCAMVRDAAMAKAAWAAKGAMPEFVSGDDMIMDGVVRAAIIGRSAEVIVHAVNPPGYMIGRSSSCR